MPEQPFDLSRREFMYAGSTSLLAIQGGGIQPQQENPDNPEREYEFAGAADLVGPASARPAPDDPFFDNKKFYTYRYHAWDTGEWWYITQDDDNYSTIPMPIDTYSTPYDALKTADQITQFALDPSKGLTRRRYHYYSNNTFFDDTLFTDNDSTGTIDIDTGGTTADTARIHSAISGQYLAQSLAQPGLGLDISSSNVTYSNGRARLSHGSIALGVGWHDKSAGGWGVGGPVQTFLGIRYTSTGAEAVLVANGQHLGNSPVPQDEWNMDTMDGSGDGDNTSGLQLRPDSGYVYQFPYTWYGHGSLYIGITHPDMDTVVRFHKFSVPRVSFDRPNMPPLLVVDDGGTSASLSAKIGGMQYALYGSGLGEEGTEERGIDATRDQFSVSTAATYSNDSVDPIAEPGTPVISFRRQAGVRDLAVRLNNIFAEVDAPLWVFSWDEYDPGTALTNANFRNPNEAVHPDDETYLLVDTAATDYSPSTAVGRGIDYLYTGKNQESLTQLSTDDRVPIDGTRVITAVTRDSNTTVTVDPTQARIVEGY